MKTPDELNDPNAIWPYYTIGEIVIGEEKVDAVLLRPSPPDQEKVDVIILDDFALFNALAGKLIAVQRHQFHPICDNAAL